jgi:NAD(P)H dehydrogenase (quinone)
MSYVVTGATGHLGRLAVESLLARGVPPGKIVATGRNLEKIKDLADSGVAVRAVDFDDPASLAAGFADATRLLLVSAPELGRRVEQHTNVIRAAADADVELLVYTSIANADTSTMKLAAEHQGTEQVLRASSVPFALVRNGWYLENYTAQIPTYVEHGAIVGSAGEGRVSAATRAELADAAATVLVEGQPGAVYELGGDDAFTMSELAAAVSAVAGTQVTFQNLPVDGYAKVLEDAGVPEPIAEILADADHGVARGELLVKSGDLARLIDRRPTSMADAVAAATN